MTHAHPLSTNKNLNHTMLLEGKHRSAIIKRSKVTLKITNQENATNDDNENNFIKILLNTNDEVLTFAADKGHCSDVNDVIQAEHWSTMPEAGNLCMNQQRVTKKS